MAAPRRRHVDYTVACICPRGVELAPAKAMLDQVHPDLPMHRDQNSYVLGDMVGHNVVIAVLPEVGMNAAATVAIQLLNDFPAIRFGLLVGIGGGVPSQEDDEEEEGSDGDIRLGDVVVSKSTSTFGGVVQYDLGKYSTSGGFERKGILNKPPILLRSTVERLAADHRMKGSQVVEYLSAMLQKYPAMKEEYSHPGAAADILFTAKYPHAGGRTCKNCDPRQVVKRSKRQSNHPRFHYGTIGSANTLVKDATIRELLRRDMKLKCVEMEAAGLMDSFPCLVIRGICDYADSHRNRIWQPYAAATAAAYMKELLSVIIPREMVSMALARDIVDMSKYDPALNLFDAPDIGSNNMFVGRERELEDMRACLQSNIDSFHHKVLVLSGIRGVGKTQLAIAYAKRYRNAYSTVFWLNAASEATLTKSFQLMAKKIALMNSTDTFSAEQLRHHVSNWLSQSHNANWLLILDNFDDPDQYDIGVYYPYGSHGSIIITSRYPSSDADDVLLIQPLSDMNQSLQILQKLSERENVRSDFHARCLAERLEGLPLALVAAGSCLHKDKSTWTFRRYLREFVEQWNFDRLRLLQPYEYPEKAIYTTWSISYQLLEKRTPDAAQFLKLLAYFGHHSIWYELFSTARHDDALPPWLLTVTGTSVNFHRLMSVLVDYCFVEVLLGNNQAHGIHTYVHEWILEALNTQVMPWSYWYAFDCVANSIKDTDRETLGQSQYARYVPHALRLVDKKFDAVLNEIGEDHIERAECVAALLKEQSQPTAAEAILLIVLRWKEKTVGKRASVNY